MKSGSSNSKSTSSTLTQWWSGGNSSHRCRKLKLKKKSGQKIIWIWTMNQTNESR